MYPLTKHKQVHVTIIGENKPINGVRTMPDKNSYSRLKSSARVTTYFTEAERDWIDSELIPEDEPRTEYVRRLIYEDAIRQGKKPPFEIKRLSSQ